MMNIFSQSLLFSPWFLSILSLIPFLALLFLIKQRKQPFKLPPSPPTLPIIGNLHQLGKLPHLSLHNLSRNYGPIMLLHLGKAPTLVVSSPAMAEQILRTNDLECCSRPYSYGITRLSYNQRDIAFTPYSEYWRQIRKICVLELFHTKKVQSFHYVREKEMKKMINSLSDSPPKPVDLGEKVLSLTNNFICNIAFGKSYEGNQFEAYKFQEAISEAIKMLSGLWFADFFPGPLGRMIDAIRGQHRRLDKYFLDFDKFLERVIGEHDDPSRPKPEQEDIIDVLLRMSRDEKGRVRITKDNIKGIIMDVFLAAVETSSLTIVWAMAELARNPRIMEKAQAEIRGVVGDRPMVPENQIEKLKYLKMVVKETLRLHPPLTLLVPRIAMQHFKIRGYDIPRDTRIYINAWAIGRNPQKWENPNEFYPERFENNEVDFKGQHYEFIPFGAGRRVCAGMSMGVLTVELVLANLLHCFDWELPEGMKCEDISLEEEPGITVHKKIPLVLVPVKYNCQG